VIRVMAEGEDEEEIRAIVQELCEVIRKADRI
jgi:phosphomannomutase